MSSQSDDVIATRLASDGVRYTASRKALVAVLASAGRPLAVSEILQQLKGVPRGTVYRNLGVLRDGGVVRAIAGLDEFTRYELSEAFMGHHHHLACTSCGDLVDVGFSDDLERRLHKEIEQSAQAAGFDPGSHRLDVLGLCQRCQ